jgi:threonine dehydrogenase-like Zn-dependent dehydrogenase
MRFIQTLDISMAHEVGYRVYLARTKGESTSRNLYCPRVSCRKGRVSLSLIVWPYLTVVQVPEGFSLEDVVVLGDNVVTVFHAVIADLELPMPWPVPSTPPIHANDAILIWGGSSSVGQYALQILKHWGYRNLIATSSPQHHQTLKALGASHVFDYKDPNITKLILNVAPTVTFVLDCVGSKAGSLTPIASITKRGSKVAVLLPVVVKDASEREAPIYEMNVLLAADWEEGVDARGVRTHFYLEVYNIATRCLSF